ncbi:MAG: hypothetical protein ACRDQZ_19570 [Mycobacteriales bacterium]
MVRPVFLDRDVASPPPLVGLLSHCERVGLVRVLWSANSSMDPFGGTGLSPADVRVTARENVLGMSPENRHRLHPLTSEQLRERFPDAEVEAFDRSQASLKFQRRNLADEYAVWRDMTAAAEGLEHERGQEIPRGSMDLLSHNLRHSELRPHPSDFTSGYHLRWPNWTPTSAGSFLTYSLRRDRDATIAALRSYGTALPPAERAETSVPEDPTARALTELRTTHATDLDRLRRGAQRRHPAHATDRDTARH